MENEIFNHLFLASDQPTTCPQCGLRTTIIATLSHPTSQTQLHQCPDATCGFEFVVSNDVE